MKILTLVPARGGSKRLPGKNIKYLGGRPLINWTINIARDVEGLDDILVSTDDAAIAEVALQAGALVPWFRPAELADDKASSVDVCLHALDWYESTYHKVDGLLLLQPTSPFRSRQMIERGIELFRNNPERPVIGMSSAEVHPFWCFGVQGDRVQYFFDEEKLKLPSQNLPSAYVVNGSFYLIAPKILRETRTFFNKDILPLLDESFTTSIDIDTEWDWLIAEAIVQRQFCILSEEV